MSTVLDNLVDNKKMPVFFIGSGLSKRYLNNFLSWEQLLDSLRKKIDITDTVYSAKKFSIKSRFSGLSQGKLNQKMATYLHDCFLEKIEKEEVKLTSLFSQEEIDKCIKNEIDFFKFLVSKEFSEYKIKAEKEEELNALRSINQKISMVFTTNYDTFLQDEVFKDFKVYEKQDKYYFRNSNGFGELFKIHGCVNNPNGIIFCESDYEEFTKKLKLISSKLINALLDYPVIFLGYSLEDENIKAIMADFICSFDATIINEIKKNIIMIVYEEGQKELIEGEKQFVDETTGHNITLTTIKTDNFMAVYDYINKLTPSATAYELRKYQSMVSELISKCAMGEKTVYVQNLEKADVDVKALYIGQKQVVEGVGKSIDIYTNEEVIEKALKNEAFDYDNFAVKWYDSKGIRRNDYTACFLIKNKLTIPYNNTGKKFKANYDNFKKEFKKAKSNSSSTLNENGILENYEKLKGSSRKLDSIITTVCNDCFNALVKDTINIEQCRSILLKLLAFDQASIRVSNFKKATAYLLYREFEVKQ